MPEDRFVRSTYPAGRSLTRADAPPTLANPQDFGPYLAQLAAYDRQRHLDAARPSGPPPVANLLGGSSRRRPTSTAPARDTNRSMHDDFMQQQRDAAELQKLSDESSPPPLKLVTMYGQSFYVPDELHMTAAQRKRFLPNESQIVGGGGGGGAPGTSTDPAGSGSDWDSYLASATDPYGTIAANRGGTKNPGYGGSGGGYGSVNEGAILDPQDDPGSSMYRK